MPHSRRVIDASQARNEIIIRRFSRRKNGSKTRGHTRLIYEINPILNAKISDRDFI